MRADPLRLIGLHRIHPKVSLAISALAVVVSFAALIAGKGADAFGVGMLNAGVWALLAFYQRRVRRESAGPGRG